MLAAAFLPLVVLVGALGLITEGAWPEGLVSTILMIAIASVATLAVMHRLLSGLTGDAGGQVRQR